MFKSLKLGYVPSALLQERIGKGAACGFGAGAWAKLSAGETKGGWQEEG